MWSVTFLLAFPTSFYFGSAYSESLFFLLVISYFYLVYKKRIILASLLGAFASAARLIGIFLVLSIKPKLKISNILPLTIIPLGILSYILYLTLVFKNPLYFISAQQVFGQERSVQGIVLLPQVFWRYFKIVTTTSGVSLLNASFELISTIFVLTLLVLAYKKVKGEWLIFSLAAVLIPTLSGTLASMPRYILVAFPMYIVLAQIKNTWAKIIILSIFFVLLVVLTAFFTRGYWIA
jgi:Gpi18-like mannosyltransferase